MHPTVPLDGGSAEGNPSCAVGGRHGHPGRSYLPVMLSTGATARCEVAFRGVCAMECRTALVLHVQVPRY